LKAAAIILAAGKSSRMGRNKLLLEVEGRSVLDRLLDAVLVSKVDYVVIVLGHKPGDITPIAESRSVRTVLNVDYERGMTSSFQTGLSSIQGDAVFLILGDMLGLTPELLDSMVDYMESNPEALIVSPVFEGKRGHPTLFRSKLYEEILNLPEGENMKHIVLRHEEGHHTVAGTLWCTFDFDTPEQFRKALNLYIV
jgi:molybdenum cofactor cytidylyltransferase